MSAATALQELGLPRETIKALSKQAKRKGKSAPEYLRSLIETDLLASQSFDELLAPVREGFQKSGVTSAELDAIVRKARKGSRARRGRRQ